MVRVVVRDQHCQRAATGHEICAESTHLLDGAHGPDSGVDEETLTLTLDHEAVSARPAAEDEHSQDAVHGRPAPGTLSNRNTRNAAWPYMIQPSAEAFRQ
jgi:hypothetical protein